jgi:hypothetical protein
MVDPVDPVGQPTDVSHWPYLGARTPSSTRVTASRRAKRAVIGTSHAPQDAPNALMRHAVGRPEFSQTLVLGSGDNPRPVRWVDMVGTILRRSSGVRGEADGGNTWEVAPALSALPCQLLYRTCVADPRRARLLEACFNHSSLGDTWAGGACHGDMLVGH